MTIAIWQKGVQTSAMLAEALRQVDQIESLCLYTDRDREVTARVRRTLQAFGVGRPARQVLPPDIPQPELDYPDRLVAMGLHIEIWHGLGIVGLWAAIDAFRERNTMKTNDKTGKSNKKRGYEDDLTGDSLVVLGELDDLRNLFAHNFAGVADEHFFQHAEKRIKPRFQKGITTPLLSKTGSKFDGNTNSVSLTIDDLRFYCAQARAILRALDAKL